MVCSLYLQFKRYCDSVANTSCAREQRSLLARGPPVNLRDRLAFPESDDQEIHSLWYAKDKAIHSARLKDSLVSSRTAGANVEKPPSVEGSVCFAWPQLRSPRLLPSVTSSFS